ncbi:MAG: hypothetical protein GY842_11700 [bacterium]|nr:hypothetical protein [bacterium]
MLPTSLWKPTLVAVGLSLALAAGTVYAGPGETALYKAYYLEQELGDVDAAGQLYAKALSDGGLTPTLESQARRGLASCREESACRDFARLMPPDTWVYLELNNPGEQFGDLLSMLGLLGGPNGGLAAGDGRHVSVSPMLIDELMGIRGAAVAITGFDLTTQMPMGVAVFHPGNIDTIRGIIETALPAAAEAVKPIQGHPTFLVEDQAFVCLTSRLVVVSPQRPQIVGLLRRLEGKSDKSFATSEAMADVLANRDDAALFFCVNAEPIMPMVTALAPASRDLAMANAVVDLNSLSWIAGKAGVGNYGLFLDMAVGLDAGHHNMVYNLMRTPPITRDTLRCIPQGTAGFLAAALGEAPAGAAHPAGTARNAPPITGLDFGRELFANIVDFAVYALPPAGDGVPSVGPVPDLAAVIRVNDPDKSQALWTQILGIASMAAGAPTTDGKVEPIGGADVHTYKFPDGVKILFATVKDKVVIAATRQAMSRAVSAAAGGASILDDPAFAASLERITENTSKAIFVHPGRCFEIGKRFMNEHELDEAEPVMAMLTDMVASVLTDESEEQFRLSASATGLPDVGDFVAQMLQQEQRRDQLAKEIRKAKKAHKWDEALVALDAAVAEEPGNLGLMHKRFDILATGKKDHNAAVSCARAYMKMTDSGHALNNLAWGLLTDDQYGGGYNDLALELAERACELTGHGDWAILDTLARANFDAGNVDQAIKWQRKALTLQGGDRSDVKKALALYESAQNEAEETRTE